MVFCFKYWRGNKEPNENYILPVDMRFSVPQGSILCPLFLFNINYMPMLMNTAFKAVLFAGHTSVLIENNRCCLEKLANNIFNCYKLFF